MDDGVSLFGASIQELPGFLGVEAQDAGLLRMLFWRKPNQ